jgi:hypothetical protein
MALTNPIALKQKCRKCGRKLTLKHFEKTYNKSGQGLRKVCRKCRRWVPPKDYWKRYRYSEKKLASDYKYRNSAKGKRRNRQRKLKREYAITLEDYDKMFKSQNGVCAICGAPEIGKRLAVDHDHTNGMIRGLLCQQCNCMLGFIENKNISFDVIQRYLEV